MATQTRTVLETATDLAAVLTDFKVLGQDSLELANMVEKRGFVSSLTEGAKNPQRYTELTYRGVRVIVDYIGYGKDARIVSVIAVDHPRDTDGDLLDWEALNLALNEKI